MIDLDLLSLRDLQVESAKALATIEATNNNISQFNKQAHHNSQQWYRAVILWYIDQYGDLPSVTGPGKDVKLIHNV
jgi:transcriptional regulator